MEEMTTEDGWCDVGSQVRVVKEAEQDAFKAEEHRQA